MAADGNDNRVKTTAEIGIYSAVIDAQAEAKQIEKDARNQFHKYNYVSAEGMIHEAKVLFAKHGLALIPVSSTLEAPVAPITGKDDNDWERNSRSASLLRSTWLIVHKGGGTLSVSTAWPVAPEKGRPIDKAVAAARTASLSYLLRDILQIPRVEEGTDLDGDDRDRDVGSAQGHNDGDPIAKAISAELDRLGLAGPARSNRVRMVLKRDPQGDEDLRAVLADLKKQAKG
jgi:hypothetical protein